MNIREYFQKNSCWQVVTHFINVLRINMAIVDQDGHIIIPSEQQKYGGKLYADPVLRAGLLDNSIKFIDNFKEQGKFLEYVDCFELHSFALPIQIDHGDEKTSPSMPMAYMIIGPVILNKRLDPEEYCRRAKEVGLTGEELIDEINELKVVSNIMMNSILELLQETIRNNISLSAQMDTLESFLDLAVKMTQSEFGSIMLLDEEKRALKVTLTKGTYSQEIKNQEVKIGEGIAGLAAQENTSFLINRDHPQNRIAHLLKRQEIKESLVMPLTHNDQIFGVLNLGSTKDTNKIEDNFDALQYLASQITI